MLQVEQKRKPEEDIKTDLSPEKIRDILAEEVRKNLAPLKNWNGEKYPDFPTSEQGKISITDKFAKALGIDPQNLNLKVEQDAVNIHIIGQTKDGKILFQLAAEKNDPPLSGAEIDNEHFYIAPNLKGVANSPLPSDIPEMTMPKVPNHSREGVAYLNLESLEKLQTFMKDNRKALSNWDGQDSFNPPPSSEKKQELLQKLKSIIGLDANDKSEISISNARGAIVINLSKEEKELVNNSRFTLRYGAEKIDPPEHYTSEIPQRISPSQTLERGLATTSSFYQAQLERWDTRTSEEDKAKIIAAFQKHINKFSDSVQSDANMISDITVVAGRNGIEVRLLSGEDTLASFSQAWITDTEPKQPISDLDITTISPK